MHFTFLKEKGDCAPALYTGLLLRSNPYLITKELFVCGECFGTHSAPVVTVSFHQSITYYFL